ncbi:MAG TPA: SDR family NAD(P)-dependent oxidoreductase, partial [Saprospiraceae bacterium]|nr:SDR family NAD(P)-dependent oxidoreductase [Saprospiraceae bacterium]
MSNKLFNLKNKTALITGASHGLGMAIAIGLAKAGAKIVINGRSRKRLDAATKVYKKQGVNVASYVFDVTKEKQVIKSIKKIEKEVGPIDILVNNAAIIERVPILEMEVKDFTNVLTVDLVGPFIMAKHVVPG